MARIKEDPRRPKMEHARLRALQSDPCRPPHSRPSKRTNSKSQSDIGAFLLPLLSAPTGPHALRNPSK